MALMLCALITTSCDKKKEEESKIDTSEINLKCKETMTLNNRGASFEIDDDFIASVSGSSITGCHIGKCVLKNEKGDVIQVNVTGNVNYIDAPCMSWGASMPNVRALQKSGTLLDESSTSLLYGVYSGAKVKYLYMYTFEKGLLKSSAVVTPTSDVSTLANWLSERFFMLPISGSESIAAGGYNASEPNKATTICAISAEVMSSAKYPLYSKYCYLVLFIPNNPSTKSADDKISISKDIMEYFERNGIEVKCLD